MKTLKEVIIEALEDSADLIEITHLNDNCEHELKVDFEKMAENVKAVVKAHIASCPGPENIYESSGVRGVFDDAIEEDRKVIMESLV